MKGLDNLPMDVVMKLYRQKLAAEKKGNHAALIKLETDHPDLFSTEFNDFIFNLKACIEYFHQQHGEDFRKMVEPEEDPVH